jgi:hypothetical protein
MDLIQRAQQIKNETAPKANTAERVGGLFEDIVTPASGRLSYFNQASISLTQNVAQKLDIAWNISREVNVDCDPENNEIKVLTDGEYSCYGMVTFTGSNNTRYDIQLRKNGVLICNCNPQTELPQGREANLVSFDVADFEAGDALSLWIVSTKTESINVQRAKLVIKK